MYFGGHTWRAHRIFCHVLVVAGGCLVWCPIAGGFFRWQHLPAVLATGIELASIDMALLRRIASYADVERKSCTFNMPRASCTC